MIYFYQGTDDFFFLCYFVFSEGSVDLAQLPHPVLVHLRSFFDLWDSFVLQAVQTDQPNISDHLMFEVRGVFPFNLHCMLCFDLQCKKTNIYL